MKPIAPILAALALAACQSAAPQSDPAPDEGQRLYRQHCTACHGETGRGTGPGAAELPRAPADLTRLAAPGGAFPHARVMSQIDGHLRRDADHPGMPHYGEILTGPTVHYDTGDGIATPTPRPLVAISEYLEELQDDTTR